MRVLLAPSTLGASSPVIVSDGLVQSRSTAEPRADELHARRDAGLGAQPVLGVVDVGGRPACSPSTATLPVVVVQGGEQAGQRHQGVGHQPAPHAGVDGVGQRADADVDAHEAAQAGGQGGYADVPVAAVGDHDHVGREVVAGARSAGRARVSEPTSSSPSMNIVTPTPRSSPRARIGREVRDDPGLVVGGAAGVEAAVALGRLEGRGVPLGVVVLGLHVVVGVEQHRRLALGRGLARDHGRRAAVLAGADDLDVLEALGPEQRRPRPRRCAAPRRPARGRR